MSEVGTKAAAVQGFVSPPVRLNLKDLTLDRTAAASTSAISKPSHVRGTGLPNGSVHESSTSQHVPNGFLASDGEPSTSQGTPMPCLMLPPDAAVSSFLGLRSDLQRVACLGEASPWCSCNMRMATDVEAHDVQEQSSGHMVT